MEWISVDDRLPMANVQVMVVDEDDCIQIGRWQKGYHKFVCSRLPDDEFDNEIYYWMPLPLTPKEIKEQ